MSQTAKLFMNGRSQAVRLPAAFRFEGVTEVYIRQNPETGDIILSPKKATWDDFLALPSPTEDEVEGFMDDRDQGVWSDKDLF